MGGLLRRMAATHRAARCRPTQLPAVARSFEAEQAGANWRYDVPGGTPLATARATDAKTWREGAISNTPCACTLDERPLTSG